MGKGLAYVSAHSARKAHHDTTDGFNHEGHEDHEELRSTGRTSPL
jgi:hypothetical protein